MKRFFKIIVGGKIGICTWIFAITAILVCYYAIGGAGGVMVGTAVAKISWIPYVFGVARTIWQPADGDDTARRPEEPMRDYVRK